MERADLHIHTTASDGSDAPDTIADLAAGAGLSVFAVTDHDSIAGAVSLLAHLPKGIRYIQGVEFSAMAGKWACHIVGYDYDPENPDINEAIDELKRRRIRKTEMRIENLAKVDGIVLTPAEKDWIFSNNSPGRTHIADVLIRRGLVSSVPEAFRTLLNSAHSPIDPAISRISAEQACGAASSAGGITGWAHPLGGEGERRLSAAEFEERLQFLLSAGIRALECYYSRYTEEESEFLVGEAEKYGLLISGGSDYHGTRKNIPIGTLNADGKQIPAEKLTILGELM